MKMKKLFVILFLTILIILNCNFVLATNETTNQLSISAESAFLIDNNTNKVLYNKNENQKMYPASTTKILTAIIVLENCNLNDTATASYNAVMSIPEGYSVANIQIDEQFTIEQLLELLLVHSANDAANVLAEHVGGSIDSFVAMMNTKVNELGLSNSHFINAYGKHDDNHYTTAHDLAYIMKYCLKNETFRKIAGQASCAIPATNKYGTRTYNSTNELLIPGSSYYYKYLTAGKTGYTSQAKECLVSSSYQNDLELICVTLGSNNRFSDTRKIYEYGYSNYSLKNIVNENDIVTNIEVANATKDTKNLNLLIDKSISALVKTSDQNESLEPEITLNPDISAPIEEGSILGEVKYSVDGIEYTANLIAANNVDKSKVITYVLYLGIIIIFIFCFSKLLKKSRKKKRY